MRHSDCRGLEKDAKLYDDEFSGLTARSVDDHYNSPLSPISSSEFFKDSSNSNNQEHSLMHFIAPKKTKSKKKNARESSAVTKVEEEESTQVEERPTVQKRGRLPSREFSDTQFDMEPDDEIGRPLNQGESFNTCPDIS